MSINLTVVIDNDEAIRKFRELQKTAKTVTSSVVTDADRMDIAMRLAWLPPSDKSASECRLRGW